MGWIADRHMRNGGSLNRRPGISAKKAQAPLRQIVEMITYSGNIFCTHWVRLSCGHEGPAWGMKRARCMKCLEEPPDD